MSNDTVIFVENVSKLYRLGLISSGTLSHDLDRWWARVRGKPDPLLKIGEEDHGNRDGEFIWALKDISIDVKEGEILGIIGPNGAGKSTLLKILSQVTAPTSGQIKVKGRVASLLEVGTGFHPELTGRENVYLNGAILGMTKAEIDRKFDEIVDFSGVEKFIDTPVKRYSSGMYVRLAFAVAAHLEPEILLVDEVLAVGDVAFQKKCLGKMGDVAKGGRTVLFVSHNMLAVRALCARSILLSEGSVVQDGESEAVIQAYLSGNDTVGGAEVSWTQESRRPGNKMLKLLALRTRDVSGRLTSQFPADQPITIEFEFYLSHLSSTLAIGFDLTTADGTILFRSHQSDEAEEDWVVLTVGRNIVQCKIPPNLLRLGRHLISARIGFHFGPWIVNSEPLLSFSVIEGEPNSRFWIVQQQRGQFGVIAPVLHWQRVEGI